MICKNHILELNSKRPCWFPISSSSPFGFCSRCDFFEVKRCLKEIHLNIELLNSEPFLNLCLNSAHQTSVISALLRLLEKDSSAFQTFLAFLSSKNFLEDLHHQIHTHFPSTCCKLYQHILKTRTFDRQIQSTDMPWNCWDCLSFILKQKNMLNCYRAFCNGILTNRIKKPESSLHNLVDCMISLHLHKKDHTARLLFDRVRCNNLTETRAKELLLEFLTKPATLSLVFTSGASEFIPMAWKHHLSSSFLQKEALKAVKKRNYIFKEDLIIKTWHPDRLFPWCLDIEELKDFDV